MKRTIRIQSQFCRGNYTQPTPNGGNGVYTAREIYSRLRSEMRRRKRAAEKHGYTDMDVLWYEHGLGLSSASADVTRRTYYGWGNTGWLPLDRKPANPLITYHCITVYIPGPCHPLP